MKEEINGGTSDGSHTFDELYHHRTILFAVICSCFKDRAWKSKQHGDGTEMYDGYFLAGIDTPAGQATYHCELDYWDMFNCKELPVAPPFDGHTSEQAIERIATLKNLTK